MSLYRIEGIVLRSSDLGEADRLVGIYTPDRGKLRLVAKGSRRHRSRLSAGIQPFTRSMFLCWHGRNLDGISQLQVLESFRMLREDLEAMAAAVYACELVDALAAEGDANPRLYKLLLETLRVLSGNAGRTATGAGAVRSYRDLSGDCFLLLAFQWQALAALGFCPELERCIICGDPLTIKGGDLGFSPAEGGVICRRHSGDSGIPRVPGKVIGALRGLLRVPLRAAPLLRLMPGDAGVLIGLSRSYLSHVLERDLRSKRWLDMLGIGKPFGEG